ncbi:FtsX-like permease family protein [Nocardioides sp. SOB77]|uniref:FtsX-like permease family protein n=1 Tax=Nocardioides oceani TaxID=3058369 RepID=A0ABT8FMZ5_9ACTN|nr:ABC transporter permease [Nocardioides oceani]MDN4175557.1 FtsX-like permease family protein [Nocardioides oceani]
MFLARRELVFARGRFALMGVVVALIALLMVLLSGLSVGLVDDGVSGLQRLPVTSLAFQDGVSKDSAFSRSVVSEDAVAQWADQPGVAEAEPFGNTLVNARTDRDVEIDLALFGVELGGFLDPEPAEGERLAGVGEAVVSATAHEAGVDVGDTLVLEPAGTEIRVVGILAEQHTYGHVDVAYVQLSTWQEAKAGVREGDVVADRVYDEVTAVAVRGDGSGPDLAAGDDAAGTTSMTLEESYAASPGYSAETSTLQLIQGFLFAISALVVGAFFTVLTVQRTGEIAVLRALGAGTGYLVRDSLLESLFLLVVSSAVGVGLGVAAGAAIGSTPMPFALEAAPIATAIGLLVALGVLGAAAAVVRITRVDPLTALGGNR